MKKIKITTAKCEVHGIAAHTLGRCIECAFENVDKLIEDNTKLLKVCAASKVRKLKLNFEYPIDVKEMIYER